MPNHVVNHLIIHAEGEKLAGIKQFLHGKDGEEDLLVCLNNIDPCPSSYLEDGKWYDWRIHNWGTKWDTYENMELSDNVIEFQTAWSTPTMAMLKLSAIFHNVEFTILFADEDAGYNCGEYSVLGGSFSSHVSPKEGSDEAMEYYFATHEWARDEFTKNPQTGQWEWAD